MDAQEFEKVWRQFSEGKPLPAKKREKRCIYAQHFEAWAEGEYQEAANRLTLVVINQKILLLIKKYFEWRAVVPKAHRNRIGERGHLCIFHIMERTFMRLKVLELSLSPPMLFLPPPPQPPAPKVVHQIAGITLGEVMGDDE